MSRAFIMTVLSLIPGFISGLATKSDYFSGRYDLAVTVIVTGAVITVLLLCVSFFLWYRALGPHAVEVFLLDAQNRLLLYRHPFHEWSLPPGGKVDLFEPLHEAVIRTLRSRVGLEPGDYELLPLHPSEQLSRSVGDVKTLPCPFRVHAEYHKQRRLKKHHVDFLFYGRLKEKANFDKADRDYQPVSLVSRNEMRELKKTRVLPADVLDAYDAILGVLRARPS